MDLPEGKHEYRFLVDGEWKTDMKEKTMENPHGTLNNYLTVDQQDFEELENALLKDPHDKKDDQPTQGKPSTPGPQKSTGLFLLFLIF